MTLALTEKRKKVSYSGIDIFDIMLVATRNVNITTNIKYINIRYQIINRNIRTVSLIVRSNIWKLNKCQKIPPKKV